MVSGWCEEKGEWKMVGAGFVLEGICVAMLVEMEEGFRCSLRAGWIVGGSS